jgi:hypothetical protein
LSITVAVLNLILGLVYTQYGTMTLIEMKRGWRRFGYSHFGAAWVAMAFTCGPHHIVHGVHGLFEGRHGGMLDLIAVVVGLPFGVTWFLLRIEAFRGGSGDRFVSGTPRWVTALPVLSVVYLVTLAASAGASAPFALDRAWITAPNFLLVGIYSTIGYYLARTQLANRRPLGGWSISGLSLAFIFPTCAAMHGIFAMYVLTGRYGFDVHGFSIDWFAVPAGMYFLWVVQRLYRDQLSDWNSNTPSATREPAREAPAVAV